MNNDNKPPSLTKFSKYLDGKLQSHLEWPNHNKRFGGSNISGKKNFK